LPDISKFQQDFQVAPQITQKLPVLLPAHAIVPAPQTQQLHFQIHQHHPQQLIVPAHATQLGTDKSKIPEFTYNGGELTKPMFDKSFHHATPFHRNCYENLRFVVPPQSSASSTNYEGYRVYIHPELGYSGNAKRFKRGPDNGERALVLYGKLYDSNMQQITQCQTCEEYFKDSHKQVLLIKNNVPIYITKGELTLQSKIMCCSTHHQNSAFYFHISLYDTVENKVVMASLFAANVKQWKNMSSSTGASAPNAKRRKTEPP
jgi:hypothetical protein